MAQAFKTFKAQREARAQFTTENGEIFAWYVNPDNKEQAAWRMRFATMADFEAYRDEITRIYKGIDMEPAELMAGTEADAKKAEKAWQRKHDQERNKAYNEKADKELARYRACVESLEALPQVIEKFTGKVINKRFHDAVKEATGFSSEFSSRDSWELQHYGWSYNERPHMYINSAKIAGVDRLDDEAAQSTLARIQEVTEQYKKYIDELEATKGKYMAYVHKVNKLAKMINELEAETSFHIREFGKQNYDLDTCHFGYIWK